MTLTRSVAARLMESNAHVKGALINLSFVWAQNSEPRDYLFYPKSGWEVADHISWQFGK